MRIIFHNLRINRRRRPRSSSITLSDTPLLASPNPSLENADFGIRERRQFFDTTHFMEYTEINARQSALNTQGVQQGKNSLDKVTHHHG